MHLPARHAVAHTNAKRLPACLKSHLAASAAAFVDASCHMEWLTRYTSRD
jgi:hypothetical protein